MVCLINRLQGQHTSREIAEAFGNACKGITMDARGETGGNFAARTAAGLHIEICF